MVNHKKIFKKPKKLTISVNNGITSVNTKPNISTRKKASRINGFNAFATNNDPKATPIPKPYPANLEVLNPASIFELLLKAFFTTI